MTVYSAFLATSLDGYMARQDGQIDWLEQANTRVSDGEDCGYARFFDSIDSIVLGRKTFEKVMSFPSWPYGKKKVFVLSRTLTAQPEKAAPHNVTILSMSVSQLDAFLQSEGARSVYVDGGDVVRQFIQSALLNEITITRIPVLIHSGTRLFEGVLNIQQQMCSDIWLELIESKSWPFGFTQERWKFLRKSSQRIDRAQPN